MLTYIDFPIPTVCPECIIMSERFLIRFLINFAFFCQHFTGWMKIQFVIGYRLFPINVLDYGRVLLHAFLWFFENI